MRNGVDANVKKQRVALDFAFHSHRDKHELNVGGWRGQVTSR